MSFVFNLKKQLDRLRGQHQGEMVENTVESTVRPEKVLRCRVCGFEGRENYCPECLACTMEPPNPGAGE